MPTGKPTEEHINLVSNGQHKGRLAPSTLRAGKAWLPESEMRRVGWLQRCLKTRFLSLEYTGKYGGCHRSGHG